MNCAVCQDLFQQRLDGLEPAEQAAAELHLRTCPECRSLYAAGLRLQQGLRLLSVPCPPSDLAGRLTACLRAEHRNQRRARRRVVLWGAVAAALLLMLSARLLWKGKETLGPRQDINSSAQTRPQPPPREQEPEPPIELREGMSQVGSVVADAAARAADATVAETRSYLPLVPKLQLPAADAPPQPLREAGEGVSVGLAPVTDSTRRAFDLFMHSLPPMNLDEKKGL